MDLSIMYYKKCCHYSSRKRIIYLNIFFCSTIIEYNKLDLSTQTLVSFSLALVSFS